MFRVSFFGEYLLNESVIIIIDKKYRVYYIIIIIFMEFLILIKVDFKYFLEESFIID